MQSYLNKKEALSAMAIGICIQHRTWAEPEHEGCLYAYIHNGEVWQKNTNPDLDNCKWLELEEFISNT